MKVTVSYEKYFDIELNKAFELTLQWLNSQHKVKIKKSSPPSFIEVKQGTMMTNTGHDPNWKKLIRISFYSLEKTNTLVRIQATPLSRTIFRVDKLKQSWYDGLFSYLFSILQKAQESAGKKEIIKMKPITQATKKCCSNCGKQIDKDAVICPRCGVDFN